MAKVSIITPVYNTGVYLKRCLSSLCEQTYQDLEIILIDNNSDDELTLSIIESYRKKDSRIRYYKEPRQGLSIAYNSGLERVSGDYIVFVDSDDYLKKEAIAILLKEIEESGADLVGAGYYLKFDHFKFVRKGSRQQILTKIEALRKLCKNTGVNNYVWAKIYKAKLLKDIRFNESYNNFSDMEYTAKVLVKADKIAMINKRLYYYYQRKGSSTNGMSYKEALRMFACFKMQEDYLNKLFPTEHFSMYQSFYRSEIMILLGYLKSDTKDIYLPQYDDRNIWFIFKVFRYILWQIVCLKKGLGLKKIERRSEQ